MNHMADDREGHIPIEDKVFARCGFRAFGGGVRAGMPGSEANPGTPRSARRGAMGRNPVRFGIDAAAPPVKEPMPPEMPDAGSTMAARVGCRRSAARAPFLIGANLGQELID